MVELCHHCKQTVARRELVYAEDHAGDEQPFHAKCYAIVTDPRYLEWLEGERADRRRNERLGL